MSLRDREQALWAALAVFAGGFTVEAAKSVCPSLPVDALLPRLVERSMVVESGVPARYRVKERGRRPVDAQVHERHLLWAPSSA